MNLIIAWIVKRIGASVFLSIINVFYVGAIVTFYIFIINAILFLHNQIQLLFNYISSSSSFGGSLQISHMFGYLNVMGFFDAFSTAFPLIQSALAFLLMRFLWKYTLSSYQAFVKSVSRVSNTF